MIEKIVEFCSPGAIVLPHQHSFDQARFAIGVFFDYCMP